LLSLGAESLYLSVLLNNIKIKMYRNIVLPIVLYGCETSLTLREEHRLRVFKNRLLREIVGDERDEVRGIEKIT